MMMNIQIDPKFLENKEPEKKHIPIGLLRYETQEYIKDLAKVHQVDIDFATSSVYAVAAGALCNRVTSVDKKKYPNSPALWLCHVAVSGYGKSPVESAVMQPLVARQEMLKEEWEAENANQPQLPDGALRPDRKRAFIDDTSPEATFQALSENPHGALLYNAELAAWLKDIDRYGSSGLIEKYLKIWSGEPVDIKRITRNGEWIKNPCMPVFGGTQPERLRPIFGKKDLVDNGFNARILWVYPDATLPMKYHESSVQENLAFRWVETVSRLCDLSPYQLTFSPKAQVMYREYWEDIQRKTKQERDPANQKMLKKLQVYVQRWALLTAVLSEKNWCENLTMAEINEDCMIAAIEAMELFEHWGRKANFEIEGYPQYKKSEKITKVEAIRILNEAYPIKNKSLFAESLGIDAKQVRRALEKDESISVDELIRQAKLPQDSTPSDVLCPTPLKPPAVGDYR